MEFLRFKTLRVCIRTALVEKGESDGLGMGGKSSLGGKFPPAAPDLQKKRDEPQCGFVRVPRPG